jgi:hypothetical protein
VVPGRRTYTDSLLSLTDTLTSAVTGTISSLSYPPVVSAARYAIFAMMARSITYGRLKIITTQGTEHVFPESSSSENGEGTTATIRVLRDTFWLRLVTQGDLGFSEAYMEGDCEVSDLVSVFQVSKLASSLWIDDVHRVGKLVVAIQLRWALGHSAVSYLGRQFCDIPR